MGSPQLAVVLVHYHTPDLVREAVSALKADLGLTGLEAELVVVDHGSSPEGRRILESLPARRLDPGENRGYAGGIHFGLEHTTAPLVVAMNPDVLVRPGCLQRLAAAVQRGAAAVGPRFFLDLSERLRIPPTEERTRRAELLGRLAERGPGWALHARRRWRRHARRHWQATEPIPSSSLSGALLVFPRRVAEAVPFDPGYRLYFEEDDWQKRLRRAGFATRYVPDARAVHLYGRSTRSEPRADAWFTRSRRRFEHRWYGVFTSWLLHLATPREPSLRFPEAEPLPPGRPEIRDLPRGGGRWMELAPSAKGFPAAAEPLADDFRGPWRLPEDVWTSLPPGTYLLQMTDADGAECARWTFQLPEPTP